MALRRMDGDGERGRPAFPETLAPTSCIYLDVDAKLRQMTVLKSFSSTLVCIVICQQSRVLHGRMAERVARATV
jgi:hypothetical protein